MKVVALIILIQILASCHSSDEKKFNSAEVKRSPIVDSAYFKRLEPDNLAALRLYQDTVNRPVIMLDSIYYMKIDTWLVTDSLQVHFKSNRQNRATAE
ncbi:MAG: hypothetical protein CMB80_15805 [Flammeovirgaceae bacterium]|nr:hypothetical protein [Flammeovirgaceae bacterium]MBE62033.1 hypothetical protein [Flammeovirgaceae bacterium]HCX23160.1 hypothetical protein [Cytophagales bacterium]